MCYYIAVIVVPNRIEEHHLTINKSRHLAGTQLEAITYILSTFT